MRIAATLGDGCNLRVDDALPGKIDVFRRHRTEADRTSMITVLDLPVIGTDREDVARRVERLRGRLSARAYATRHQVGTVEAHRRRHRVLTELGVGMIFVALPDLNRASDLDRLSGLVADCT